MPDVEVAFQTGYCENTKNKKCINSGYCEKARKNVEFQATMRLKKTAYTCYESDREKMG